MEEKNVKKLLSVKANYDAHFLDCTSLWMTNVGPGTVLSFFVLSTVHSYEQQENKQQKSTVLSSNDDLENLEQFLKTQNRRDTVQL